MTIRRRAGAPRLIEWTGERCVPWAPDVQVVYEHLHRYMWAAELTGGRHVLDLASGEGFGASILAESAASVVGIEIDEKAVDHSRLRYGGAQIQFHVGDARDLSRFESESFGAVIAFEMIEHVEEQERVLDEIARVLRTDGLLIISTPDRRAYTEATGQRNPFHLRELDLDQFVGLLRARFAHTRIFGQRTITGSALSALDQVVDDGVPGRTFFVERDGDEWHGASGMSPLYLVALASSAELPAIAADSTLADCGIQLVRAADEAGLQSAQERIGAADARRGRELRELRTISDRDEEIELRRSRLTELSEQAREDKLTIETLRSELGASQQQTARIQQSVTWRLFERTRNRLFASIGGESSRRARVLQSTLRGAGRMVIPGHALGHPENELPENSLIELPEFDQPEVSIVVPLHSRAELTRACLGSIRDFTSRVSYEVILVDDAADGPTKALLGSVRGAQIIVNDDNIGYLRSVNRGATHARGRWLVLCNNDIQVRDGWLRAMMACASSSSEIAIVTPKYLYPDWSLNEAGGIIWRDGTGRNYGRGGNPGDCRYEFRRDVDYGSAAALMVNADFWRAAGGYDERFVPMYYEDADLCFQAREHGCRVVYEPRANVVHIEGGTAGTDTTTGHKRFQEVNRKKFVEKWRGQLDHEQLASSGYNAERASNRHRGPHVLIVDHRIPMWDRDAGSLRAMAMIRTLIDLGCRISFFPDDRHLVDPYTVELMDMGVEVWYGDVDIAERLSSVGPGLALVITCRPQPTTRWLDLIKEFAPFVPVFYDTVDLHWLREARRAAAGAATGEQAALGPRAAVLREIEIALIRATDATLVVSPEEEAQVAADVPEAVVRVIPTINEVRSPVPPVDERTGVFFIGGFEHTPNADAVLRLVRRVMPRVWRELGQVPVTIVGGSVTPEVAALASAQVDIMGWVHDVEPLFDLARVMVAPISYGAGLKGKVTQALAAGLPVVTTPIGAEGLGAVDGEQLLIGHNDGELAKRVIRALTDDELWTRLSKAGQKLAADRCSPALLAVRLGELLDLANHGAAGRQVQVGHGLNAQA